MSSEGFRKKRCIKKLDFENCIVTNIKTKARGRKKLRARITREVEDCPEVPVPSCCPPLRETSPVLTIRTKKSASPVLYKRKKPNLTLKEVDETPEDANIREICSPSSPVFKLFKKSKTDTSRCLVLENSLTQDGFFLPKEETHSGTESYRIDDITTQESKESVKISSVDSALLKDSNSTANSVQSGTAGHAGEAPANSFSVKTCESPKVTRRKYKKNSLLKRLHKLRQKQSSEKLLWQHQNRKNSSSSQRFSVVSCWKNEFNVYLKCTSPPPDSSATFLIVDTRWAPSVKSVKESSVLLLHPPWQKLTVEELGATVLVNVICVDVLEETEETVAEKRRLEVVPECEVPEEALIEALFRARSFGFI